MRFFNKKQLVFTGILIVAIFILTLLSIFQATPSGEIVPQPSVSRPKDRPLPSTVSNIKTPSLLKTGGKHNFEVNLDRDYKINQLNIRLVKKNIALDTSLSIKTTNSLAGDKLIVAVQEPIEAYSEYELTVVDQITNQTIYNHTYFSEPTTLSPIPSNNPDLIPFLPYETEAFILSFLPEKNIYIFNFKGDLNSPTPIEDQFEQAKQQAEEFILEKGVDINSITIEWKFR